MLEILTRAVSCPSCMPAAPLLSSPTLSIAPQVSYLDRPGKRVGLRPWPIPGLDVLTFPLHGSRRQGDERHSYSAVDPSHAFKMLTTFSREVQDMCFIWPIFSHRVITVRLGLKAGLKRREVRYTGLHGLTNELETV